MIQFVVGAAAGYVLGTKAGRKRYHQLKNAYQRAMHSPAAQKAVAAGRKALADRLDPQPRMRELRDLRRGRGRGERDGGLSILEPDED